MTVEPPKEIKRIKSNVEDYHDIEWKFTNGKNPIIDSAIVNDDLTLTIDFQGKKYSVRSPERRIIKKLKAVRSKEKLTEKEAMQADDLQEIMIEDMIIDFSIANYPGRIEDKDYDNLAILCWHYYEFSKKKSIARAKDFTS